MTDLRKAAELALEALELECTDINGDKVDLVTPAIAAIRQALEQPEQEWQGLTDEEIAEGAKQSWVDKQAFESAVWWAEGKLKEKNS